VGNQFRPSDRKYPRIEIEKEDELLTYFRLVKAGYGNFFEVQNMTAREVMQALYYEKFLTDYEQAFFELNKETR